MDGAGKTTLGNERDRLRPNVAPSNGQKDRLHITL